MAQTSKRQMHITGKALPMVLQVTKRTPLAKPLAGRDIPNKRNRLCTQGHQKGIPRDLMVGMPTDKLEKLVTGWPNKSANRKVDFENTTPSALSRIDLSEPNAPQKPAGN